MTDKSTIDQAVEFVTKEFVDKGKLIEAGWCAFRIQIVPAGAGPVQIEETRLAYFAGAQHLFASIMTVLDPGAQETDADLRRIALIDAELEDFANKLAARVMKANA